MIVYLELNDINISYSQKEIEEISVAVASSKKEEGYQILLDWLDSK